MNDAVDTTERDRSLKTISMVSYALHTIVAVTALVPGLQASPLLLLVALVIDLVKRDDAAGTWQASHFSWRLRTVLWAMGLYLITAPLWLLLFVPGWIAWTIISVWFVYRVIRGWLRLNDNLPMPAAPGGPTELTL